MLCNNEVGKITDIFGTFPKLSQKERKKILKKGYCIILESESKNEILKKLLKT